MVTRWTAALFIFSSASASAASGTGPETSGSFASAGSLACAIESVPWRSGVLRAKEKELIYLAVDATPTHRYLPGLRLHVVNALERGASRAEIVGALDIAAAAGPSWGIPAAR